jgi:hypothetical protein
MKALLICPSERTEVNALAENCPLASLAIFGKPLVHHWLEYLALRGTKEVTILAADRPEKVREAIGDGSRWGLSLDVLPQARELTCEEAREKFSLDPHSDHVEVVDHFPGFPAQKLFDSYNGFFFGLQFWLSQHPAQPAVGVKEIQHGIWIGMRTHISPGAKLVAPCWIGENVLIKPGAVIGPMAILENGVVVEDDAAIYESWIAAHTFAGSLIQMKDSLALASTLVNFQKNSVAKIPDEFLLSSLEQRHRAVRSGSFLGRLAAWLVLAATSPFALLTVLWAKTQGHRTMRPRRAVNPQTDAGNAITYFEFSNVTGWWRRWPQLWNVARGEFCWIGNRPLTPIQSNELANEFERLWLAAPIGLISQADAAGCSDPFSDEARAHASFYAAQANWKLDMKIFLSAMKRLLKEKPSSAIKDDETERVLQPARIVTR